MTSKDVVVQQNGFPVVFAKYFTELAASFSTEEIRVVWPGKNIISDAKSILGLMALDVTKGTALTLTAEGPNEAKAIEALYALITDK